jgi:hypothetical protein
MSNVQPEKKCRACGREVATHAAGCSLVQCPHRHPQAWDGAEGPQGFPGLLAEDRIIRRRAERDSAVPVEIEDL